MTLEEMETVINYQRISEVMYVWTSDTTVMNKFDKLCKEAPENYRCLNTGVIAGKVVDKEYEVNNKNLLSFKPRKRKLSDEQKARLAEQLNKGKL